MLRRKERDNWRKRGNICEEMSEGKRSFQEDMNADITSHLLRREGRGKDRCPGEKKCKRCSIRQHENIPSFPSFPSVHRWNEMSTNRESSFSRSPRKQEWKAKEWSNSKNLSHCFWFTFVWCSFLNFERTEDTNSTETSLMSTLFVPPSLFLLSFLNYPHQTTTTVKTTLSREQIHCETRERGFQRR